VNLLELHYSITFS